MGLKTELNQGWKLSCIGAALRLKSGLQMGLFGAENRADLGLKSGLFWGLFWVENGAVLETVFELKTELTWG